MRVEYTADTIHEAWLTYFKRIAREDIETALYGDGPLVFSATSLGKHAPEVLDTFRHDPETAHEQGIQALLEHMDTYYPEEGVDSDAYPAPWPRIKDTIRDPVPVTKIRAAMDKQLFRVTGMLATAGAVQRHPLNQVHECLRCGNQLTLAQPLLRFRVVEPYACEQCEKKGVWSNATEDTLVDYQVCRLSPRVGDEGLGMVDSLNLVLTGDLAGCASPGEDVTVHGYTVLVKRENQYEPVLVATDVDRHRAQDRAEATQEDLEQWESIVEEYNGQLPELVAEALTPHHHGDIQARMSLAMACFSSKNPATTDGRDAIHVLLIGDPATDKSGLLRKIAHALPKAVHVNAKNATRAGLTATVTQDKEFGGHRLEPGALVLANGGACCIDELDKGKADQVSDLHEAMAQLTVSLTMAGNQTLLPANASVLAGANPVNMRWDPNQSISEQLDLPATILSRFDAIHLFVDTTDEERLRGVARAMFGRDEPAEDSVPQDLAARVAWTLADSWSVTVPEQVEDYLMERFVKTRMDHKSVELVPITPRQLAAMQRFTRAHARMHLRRTASRIDAEWAANHVEAWISRVARDNLNQVNIDYIEAPGAASQRDRVRLVHEAIREGAQRFSEIVESTELDKVAVEQTLELLKRNGDVYEAEHGQYRAV